MLTEIARLARDHFTLRFDYSDRRQEASQRRVEPYRIVNAGQRWYLVAWDLDRDDWRTFRVDRMREGMSPGPRFTPRELSDADAEALVARGIPPEARQHQARVIVHAPAAAAPGAVRPVARHRDPASTTRAARSTPAPTRWSSWPPGWARSARTSRSPSRRSSSRRCGRCPRGTRPRPAESSRERHAGVEARPSEVPIEGREGGLAKPRKVQVRGVVHAQAELHGRCRGSRPRPWTARRARSRHRGRRAADVLDRRRRGGYDRVAQRPHRPFAAPWASAPAQRRPRGHAREDTLRQLVPALAGCTERARPMRRATDHRLRPSSMRSRIGTSPQGMRAPELRGASEAAAALHRGTASAVQASGWRPAGRASGSRSNIAGGDLVEEPGQWVLAS